MIERPQTTRLTPAEVKMRLSQLQRKVQTRVQESALPSLTRRQLVITGILGLAVSLICGADSTKPLFYFLGLFVCICVLASSLFLPVRLLIFPLFILIINMLDLTQAGEDI